MKKILSYHDKLILEKLNVDMKEISIIADYPNLTKSLLIILTVKGRLEIRAKEQYYSLENQTLFILDPVQHMQIVSISSDYNGIAIRISHDFLSDHGDDKGFRTINSLLRRKRNPCIPITAGETNIFLKRIVELEYRLQDKKHLFYKAVIENILKGFMLDIDNLIMQNSQEIINLPLSRRGEIVTDFLELLHKFCLKEHSVAFYAKKLCISPQYLSLIIKDQTEKTANQWISDMLINEAIHLLKYPNITIQQIAYKLNFSDQSSFGKFFKKQMLISPLRYRKSMTSAVYYSFSNLQ